MCVDRNFVVPLAVSLCSLRSSQQSPADISVTVLSIGLRSEDEARLQRSAEPLDLRFVRVHEDDIPTDLAPMRHLSRAAYGRLIGLELLATDVHRALYLDADIVVMDDLGALFWFDLDGAAVGAVQSQVIPHVSNPLGLRRWRTLGLSPTTPYLNSGVLVIDAEAWRREGLSKAVMQFLIENRDALSLGDQDGLNAILRGRFARLPLRFNVETQLREANHLGYSFFGADEVDEALENPAILHFSGPSKPWHRGCTDPARDEWLKVLRSTDFADYQPSAPAKRLRAVWLLRRLLRV